MGLFSSKKKTHVYTSVTRMVDDADFVPSNKLAVIEYSMSEDSSSASLDALGLPDYLIKATNNNIVARAKASRKYALRADYAYGPPKTSLITQTGVDLEGAIEDYLSDTYSTSVVVHDCVFGPINNYYLLKFLLSRQLNWNPVTNEVIKYSDSTGFKCYLESAVIKYSKHTIEALIDPDTLDQQGTSMEAGYTPFRAANPKASQVPWVDDYSGDNDIAEVSVVYKDASGDKKIIKEIINFSDFESSSAPIEEGLDDDSALDINPDAVAPKQPEMYDDKDFIHAVFEMTKDGVTYIDTLLYEYGSGVNKLDNIFTVNSEFGSHLPRMYARMGGRKANDESLKNTPKYKSMVGLGKRTGLNWSNWVDEIHDSVGSLQDVTQIFMTYSLPVNTKDRLTREYMYEYFYDMYKRIPNKYANTMFKELKNEFLKSGSKQGQAIVISDKEYRQSISFSALGYVDVKGKIGEVGSVDSGFVKQEVSQFGKFSQLVKAYNNYHWFRKQLSANTYREIRIYNLACNEQVTGGHSTTASGNSENLLIPLDISINNEFSPREKEELYTKSMYIVFNTVKVVKKKWYQTGVFKAIMFIAAVAFAAFTGGQSLTLYAVIMAVVNTIVIGLIIQIAAKILVNYLGIDVGVVAAIVAVVAMIYGGYLAATKTTGVAGITATQVIQAGSQAFNMSSQGFALQAQNAVKEFNSVMAGLNKEQEELVKLSRELGLGQHGPLLMFEPPISIGVRIGESPDSYYTRSIHTHNMGSAIYSLIENSVDIGVTLPSTQMILNNIQENLNDLSQQLSA